MPLRLQLIKCNFASQRDNNLKVFSALFSGDYMLYLVAAIIGSISIPLNYCGMNSMMTLNVMVKIENNICEK